VRGAVWCRLGSVALEDLEKKKTRKLGVREAVLSRTHTLRLLFLEQEVVLVGTNAVPLRAPTAPARVSRET
jgi:hypothetical protein